MSQLADGFKTVFNVVSVIAIVAVIIIMNTLVISVTERIAEIGTMRAIDVHKGFVRRMIGAETVTSAFVFGGAGVSFALVLLSILGATGIRTSNEFLRILFGGRGSQAGGVARLGGVLAGHGGGDRRGLKPVSARGRTAHLAAAGDRRRLMRGQHRIASTLAGREAHPAADPRDCTRRGRGYPADGFAGGVSGNGESPRAPAASTSWSPASPWS